MPVDNNSGIKPASRLRELGLTPRPNRSIFH